MMRTYQLLAFLVFCTTLLVSCQNDRSSDVRDQARQTLPTPQNNMAATPTEPAVTPAFNAAEPHYKCPNNCPGGGGPSAGNCPVCGTQMNHNTAYHNAAASTPTATPDATQAAATGFNTGEFHYKCPNNCAGGGGPSAGSCPVCGTQLAHNTAYHNQGATGANSTTVDPFGGSQTNAAASGTGQNTTGVYHYTCANGCAGGAGSAGLCATCGSTLVHNTAYHNN